MDTKIYAKTIKGIAKQLKTKSKAILKRRKENLILFSFHVKFLNFKENIGTSLTSKIAMKTEPMQMK
jgi:hypothetical protein